MATRFNPIKNEEKEGGRTKLEDWGALFRFLRSRESGDLHSAVAVKCLENRKKPRGCVILRQALLPFLTHRISARVEFNKRLSSSSYKYSFILS